MIFLLAFLSILFTGIAFIVTEKNAKYILSGYNTMTEAQRSQFDIKSFIRLFKRFYIFLGLSLFIIGFILTSLIGKDVGMIFLVFYPIVLHFYSISKSAKYFNAVNTKWYKWSYIILGGAMVLVAILMSTGYQESELLFDSQKIKIKGMYGETLAASDIKSIELVNELPEITLRTNGFASGSVLKGYFDIKDKENVKLIINGEQQPIILITSVKGKKIYYSAKTMQNEEIFNELKNNFPGIEYK